MMKKETKSGLAAINLWWIVIVITALFIKLSLDDSERTFRSSGQTAAYPPVPFLLLNVKKGFCEW